MVYKDIKELLQDAKNMASGIQNIQLKSVILDIQDTVYSLQEENRELRVENHELKNQQILRSELEFKNNVYYHNGNENIAYCTRCFDVDKLMVTMNKFSPAYKDNYQYHCPNCNKYFETSIKKNCRNTVNF